MVERCDDGHRTSDRARAELSGITFWLMRIGPADSEEAQAEAAVLPGLRMANPELDVLVSFH